MRAIKVTDTSTTEARYFLYNCYTHLWRVFSMPSHLSGHALSLHALVPCFNLPTTVPPIESYTVRPWQSSTKKIIFFLFPQWFLLKEKGKWNQVLTGKSQLRSVFVFMSWYLCVFKMCLWPPSLIQG